MQPARPPLLAPSRLLAKIKRPAGATGASPAILRRPTNLIVRALAPELIVAKPSIAVENGHSNCMAESDKTPPFRLTDFIAESKTTTTTTTVIKGSRRRLMPSSGPRGLLELQVGGQTVGHKSRASKLAGHASIHHILSPPLLIRLRPLSQDARSCCLSRRAALCGGQLAQPASRARKLDEGYESLICSRIYCWRQCLQLLYL